MIMIAQTPINRIDKETRHELSAFFSDLGKKIGY